MSNEFKFLTGGESDLSIQLSSLTDDGWTVLGFSTGTAPLSYSVLLCRKVDKSKLKGKIPLKK